VAPNPRPEKQRVLPQSADVVRRHADSPGDPIN
jgi:hypothetical protein